MFSEIDELTLYDLPANPFNVCVYWVIEKPQNMGDPGQYLLNMVRKLEKDRFLSKTVKVFGKYFLQKMRTEEEFEQYLNNNIAVINDITGEQEALDFGVKLKATV